MVEVLDHEVYLVKMNGTGQVSKRNWRFLKPIVSVVLRWVMCGKGIRMMTTIRMM